MAISRGWFSIRLLLTGKLHVIDELGGLHPAVHALVQRFCSARTQAYQCGLYVVVVFVLSVANPVG